MADTYADPHSSPATRLAAETRLSSATRLAAKTRFSVIIPALDESAWVGRAVRHIKQIDDTVEVIVADGGSADATRDQARAAGAEVIVARRGRGSQCHAGALRARGKILVFLHADTLLPADAFAILDDCFADPDVKIGTFRLQFDRDHWLLRLYAFFARLDSPLTRFGDQGIAIRHGFYRELGGFPDWQRLEDVHLLRQARRCTRVHSFPAAVTTSARRFERGGLIRTQLRNAGLLLGYLFRRTRSTS